MATTQIPINYIALESKPTTDMLFAKTRIPTFQLAEIGINKYVSQLENNIASRYDHDGPICLYKVKSMHVYTEIGTNLVNEAENADSLSWKIWQVTNPHRTHSLGPLF